MRFINIVLIKNSLVIDNFRFIFGYGLFDLPRIKIPPLK
jgi:hypothetical protein